MISEVPSLAILLWNIRKNKLRKMHYDK
jgi:hypothetical protein